ncbi:MAG: hypothetical protein AAFV49_14840, partial [Pseudomonadota bacterium]
FDAFSFAELHPDPGCAGPGRASGSDAARLYANVKVACCMRRGEVAAGQPAFLIAPLFSATRAEGAPFERDELGDFFEAYIDHVRRAVSGHSQAWNAAQEGFPESLFCVEDLPSAYPEERYNPRAYHALDVDTARSDLRQVLLELSSPAAESCVNQLAEAGIDGWDKLSPVRSAEVQEVLKTAMQDFFSTMMQ